MLDCIEELYNDVDDLTVRKIRERLVELDKDIQRQMFLGIPDGYILVPVFDKTSATKGMSHYTDPIIDMSSGTYRMMTSIPYYKIDKVASQLANELNHKLENLIISKTLEKAGFVKKEN